MKRTLTSFTRLWMVKTESSVSLLAAGREAEYEDAASAELEIRYGFACPQARAQNPAVSTKTKPSLRSFVIFPPGSHVLAWFEGSPVNSVHARGRRPAKPPL